METCKKIRSTVQRELLQYYAAKNTDTIRMGNVLSLLPSVLSSTYKMLDDMELMYIMNKKDNSFFNFFTGREYVWVLLNIWKKILHFLYCWTQFFRNSRNVVSVVNAVIVVFRYVQLMYIYICCIMYYLCFRNSLTFVVNVVNV